MKKYGYLVPIVLVALYVLSIFTLSSGKAEIETNYNGHIAQARSYREQGIYVDALTEYNSALEVRSSLELYLEIASLHEEFGMNRLLAELSEELLIMYPKDARAYELAMDIYLREFDYGEAFELADKVSKRQLHSEKLDAAIELIEYQYYFKTDYENVGVYTGGLCPIQIRDKWGYVDLYADQTVPAQFVKVGPFSPTAEVAPVVDGDGNAYFIDSNGFKKKVVMNVENIQELGFVDVDRFPLYNGNFWGFYMLDGTHVFGEYDQVSSMGNGAAAVMNADTWKIVDRNGVDLTGKSYAAVAMDERGIMTRNDRCFVSDGVSWSMIDLTGAVKSRNSYDDARLFLDETYAAVKMGGKWGFVDKDGNMCIEAQYEDARSFSNGLAAVKTNGLWGFIDLSGEMVIEPAFLDAKDFTTQGTVYVLTGDEWELLILYKYNH